MLRSMGVETEAPEARVAAPGNALPGDVPRNKDVMTTVLRLKNVR